MEDRNAHQEHRFQKVSANCPVLSSTAHGADAEDGYLQERKKERDDYARHLQTTWAFDVINRIKPQVGTQTIGRSTENDMVIGICPDTLGEVVYREERIFVTLDKNAKAHFSDSGARSGELVKSYGDKNKIECEDGWLYANYDGVIRAVKPDSGKDPVVRFYGVERKWRVAGKYHPLKAPVQRTVLRTSGKEDVGYVSGYVSFSLDGGTYELEPLGWPKDLPQGNSITLAFRDKTNGKSTYGGGRYLDIELPRGKDVEQEVFVDFNSAYNPLCAFDTDIACALPPLKNRLHTPVEAGEMKPDDAEPPIATGRQSGRS